MVARETNWAMVSGHQHMEHRASSLVTDNQDPMGGRNPFRGMDTVVPTALSKLRGNCKEAAIGGPDTWKAMFNGNAS